MKKLFALLPFALLAFAPVTKDPLAIGSPIPNPEAKMKDINGNEVSFKDAMGKNGLLVMFSCNTCPVVVSTEKVILGLIASGLLAGFIKFRMYAENS